MIRRPRWRTCTPGELETVTARLAGWDCPAGGAIRHMFILATLESQGPGVLRLVSDDHRWAAAVVFPGRLVVPAGDPSIIEEAGLPARRWRLMVADAAAVDALAASYVEDPGVNVRPQRLMAVDHARVPTADELPDPGLRRATPEDIPALARLAVRLHIDDEFGPDPGRSGARGYAHRLESTVRQGIVWCVGPERAPIAKIERSVSSARWGVQLAGIVVDDRQRNAGLGAAITAAAVRAALAEGPRDRAISLHVRSDNPAAIRAYEKAGFVDQEEWRLAVRP